MSLLLTSRHRCSNADKSALRVAAACAIIRMSRYSRICSLMLPSHVRAVGHLLFVSGCTNFSSYTRHKQLQNTRTQDDCADVRDMVLHKLDLALQPVTAAPLPFLGILVCAWHVSADGDDAADDARREAYLQRARDILDQNIRRRLEWIRVRPIDRTYMRKEASWNIFIVQKLHGNCRLLRQHLPLLTW